MYCSGADSARR